MFRDRSYDGQRRFIANASHELRTPLTINRTLVDVAVRRPDATEDVRRLGESLLVVNARHERLIDALLALSEGERTILDRRPFDLADVVEHVLDQAAKEAGDSEVTVHRLLDPAPTAGEAVLIERLAQNLVENGIRHNHPGGEIWVTTRSLTVRDCECLISHMTPGAPRSTAEDQRAKIVSRAVAAFAHAGYHATPVSEVAEAAEVSPAYVFRLFPGKLGLFVATVDHCYEQVAATLVKGGEAAGFSAPDDVLAAMSAAYVELIRDRNLIMLQVHAQSACDVPEIRDAVRRGVAKIVNAVSRVSGADPTAVQRFLAYGQLCHLIVQADLGAVDESWARTVSAGISH
ncbi:TetR family transcriptional regulator [Acrocarpospora macrocephala]|uniref:TetR family transcriptional regulator n=1 Tax=Acrocarpospora macrocephala TaxID=150177 RepID=UPI001FEC56C0|nr:TetR family transcriptional regulator [Acrocarpospora macrocephala]